MKRKLIVTLLMVLSLCTVGALLVPAAAYASASPGSARPDTHPLTKQIEWSHPIPIASLLKKGLNHPSTAAVVHPDAGSGILSVCTGNAYPVSYGGRSSWQTTFYNLTLQVSYLYCPGGSFGYNFAYAQASTSSGTYGVEYGANWSYQWDGASLHASNGTYEGDGQGYTGVYVSAGHPTSDYSYPGPGNLAWSAQFWVYTCNQSNNSCATVHVASPTF